MVLIPELIRGSDCHVSGTMDLVGWIVRMEAVAPVFVVRGVVLLEKCNWLQGWL